MGDKVDRPLLLVGQPLLAPLLPLLASDHDVIALWERPDAAQLARVDAVIWAGEFALDRSLIDAMPRLSLIACFTVGYDGVDLALAKARGENAAIGLKAAGAPTERASMVFSW